MVERWGLLLLYVVGLVGPCLVHAFLPPCLSAPRARPLPTKVYGGLQDLQDAQSQFGPQAGNTPQLMDEEESLEDEQKRIIEEQKVRNEMEKVQVLPDGRTMMQWLEGDKPRFEDGSLVLDWFHEAQSLRLIPWTERNVLMKEKWSFDDLNRWKARAGEWKNMLIAKGLVAPPEKPVEEGVTVLSEEAYGRKLADSISKYSPAMEQEKQLMEDLDKTLAAATFTAYGLDKKIKVVFDGHMRPVSCDVTEDALTGISAEALSLAIEQTVDKAFRESSEFFMTRYQADYEAKAGSPTEVQEIVGAFGRKEYETEGHWVLGREEETKVEDELEDEYDEESDPLFGNKKEPAYT